MSNKIRGIDISVNGTLYALLEGTRVVMDPSAYTGELAVAAGGCTAPVRVGVDLASGPDQTHYSTIHRDEFERWQAQEKPRDLRVWKQVDGVGAKYRVAEDGVGIEFQVGGFEWRELPCFNVASIENNRFARLITDANGNPVQPAAMHQPAEVIGTIHAGIIESAKAMPQEPKRAPLDIYASTKPRDKFEGYRTSADGQDGRAADPVATRVMWGAR